MRLECLAMNAPGFFVRLQVGHLPACLAQLGISGRPVAETFGELLPDEAMLRIRLPVDLEGELHERAKAFLALAERLFRRLSLGQIDDESDKLVSAFFDGCGAKHDGHSAAVFPEVLLLDWRPLTSRLMLQEPLCVPLPPVRGRQSRPADAACLKIPAVVSHDAEEGVIGFKDLAVKVRDEDPDDVRIHQAADLRLPLLKITVKTGILQGNRRLRGKQLQHRDPTWRKDMRSELVLQVQNPDELGLIDQR